MPRRNRVDPFGDLHAAAARGLFTGNRGCLVDDSGLVKRHHAGSLWIICETTYQDWKHPLNAPGTWTPLFFLDDSVGLAAGHRPCGLCRRVDYVRYRDAVARSRVSKVPLRASDLNRSLAAERLRGGRGLVRSRDRILWSSPIDDLPAGTVIFDAETCETDLVTERYLQRFAFAGWERPIARPRGINVAVLTPPTSVAALSNGYLPDLHPTAAPD